MSNRVEKVNSLLQHEINNIFLKDLNFPDGILVTLTQVDCTSNLIEAKVYISVFPEENTENIMKILNKLIYGIQQKVNKRLKMRPIPKIIFVADKGVARAGRVEELLAQLKDQENN
ncbi:MAG: 30S ribosome-binding factor RbfA [Candidatus Staskawiczbacteria bacterium]|nr:30S ribosome-binding factor RbfA [Candidatus Staskawiczbacteria bacterium]